MSTENTKPFDGERCRRRNYVAARRDGIDAVPVRFFAGEGEQPQDADQAQQVPAELLAAGARRPMTDEESLAQINALLPAGAPKLSLEQVYIHWCEAANGSFIRSRFMFLDETTLRNIANGAGLGVAFMNSHRTGGLSEPAELPFGQTFAGKYEEFRLASGGVGRRALVGVYMLRGTRPNGENGPSTDDLHAMILGGTLKDVSVGLLGGQRVCDVCGLDLYSYSREDDDEETCPHIPGSRRHMNGEQVQAQVARGVPGGQASYSLVDADFCEVSGVWDGAVTGAGFGARFSAPVFNGPLPGTALRKVLSLAKAGELADDDLRECAAAYRTVLSQHDLLPRKGEALDVAGIAAALAPLLGCDPSEEEDLPAGSSFAEHSETVLAAVEVYLARARSYGEMRQRDGRRVSLARQDDWRRLHAALGDLLTLAEAGGKAASPELEELRLRSLRMQAACLETAAGSYLS